MHPTSGDAWLLTLTGDEGDGGAAKRQGYWELLAGEHNSYVHPINRIPHHNAIYLCQVHEVQNFTILYPPQYTA